MADIKSAREIAMEKVEKIGSATEEERRQWQYVPKGEKLAAEYIKEACNLDAELNQFEENVKGYVIQGAKDIFVRNIDLPRSELAKRNTKRAMEGLRTLIKDKVATENVFSKMRRVFDHYVNQGEQQKGQAYGSLKDDFVAKVQQAMQQQFGTEVRANIDVERQPQFLEESRKMQAQLDLQYYKLLNEYKQELLSLA